MTRNSKDNQAVGSLSELRRGVRPRQASSRKVKGDVLENKSCPNIQLSFKKRRVSINNFLPGSGSPFQCKLRPLGTQRKAFSAPAGFCLLLTENNVQAKMAHSWGNLSLAPALSAERKEPPLSLEFAQAEGCKSAAAESKFSTM